ncbi:hypothetical protein HAX54_014451 [Datura stramonium]|uniref:Uncharacterized protein n=1 Tax=Datura stramonium TaxID=4076 RepID=A0ABS8RIP7_DATST|nr:hypothetical protein [Datura stramonium]
MAGKRARGRQRKLLLLVDRVVQATGSRSKQKEGKQVQSAQSCSTDPISYKGAAKYGFIVRVIAIEQAESGCAARE